MASETQSAIILFPNYRGRGFEKSLDPSGFFRAFYATLALITTPRDRCNLRDDRRGGP